MKKRIRCLVLSCFFALTAIFSMACGDDSDEIRLGEPEVIAKAEDRSESGENKEEQLITVYLCGAVVNPGVVSLAKGSRVADGLALVGGFTEDAATDYVNLAAILLDGEQITFPRLSEAEKLRQEQELKNQGKVNINTATLEELMTLTGIGETRAKDIIAYRSTNGDFEKPEDMLLIPGIKESTFDKFKDMIYVK